MPWSEGINGATPGDVSCKINKLGIKSINPDYWPLSPASPLCERPGLPTSYFCSSFLWDWAEKENELNRKCRTYSYTLFCSWRNVFGERAIRGSVIHIYNSTFSIWILWRDFNEWPLVTCSRGNPERLLKDRLASGHQAALLSPTGSPRLLFLHFKGSQDSPKAMVKLFWEWELFTVFKRAQGIPKHTHSTAKDNFIACQAKPQGIWDWTVKD